MAFSGANASPFDQENGVSSGTQPGSINPSEDGSLIITAHCAFGGAATVAGFTTVSTAFAPGTNMAGGMAYYIQPTAAAINPTWSETGTLAIASFLPA
jgi:hypothetical protein